MAALPEPPVTALTHEHAAMLALLHAARVAVLRGDLAGARDLLAQLTRMQDAHIVRENAELIPRLVPGARWPAKLYLAEHAKLADMLADLVELLAPLPGRVDDADTLLALLDALAPFRHVMEHHFDREEKGLFVEATG